MTQAILKHYASCGMTTTQESGYLDDMRTTAARLIRRRRRAGFPVITLDTGKEWEVQEPEDCMMIPDQCGILVLTELDSVQEAYTDDNGMLRVRTTEDDFEDDDEYHT